LLINKNLKKKKRYLKVRPDKTLRTDNYLLQPVPDTGLERTGAG